MDNVNLLRNTLKPHLKWHGARLSFLALFLIALFRVKTVNGKSGGSINRIQEQSEERIKL